MTLCGPFFLILVHLGGDTGEEYDDDEGCPKGSNQGQGQGVKMGPDICLLTTKACGQGITLTGENM